MIEEKSTDRKVLQIIEERIIYEIKRSSNPISMFDLFSLVYHHQTCDLELFNYALNLLTIKKVIKLTSAGYTFNLPTFTELIEIARSKGFNELCNFISKKEVNVNDIDLDYFNLLRKEAEQLPEYNYESENKVLFVKYDLPFDIINELIPYNEMLYLWIKYSNDQVKKSKLDFVIDYRLYGRDIGKNILNEYNMLFVSLDGDTLLEDSLEDLFYFFMHKTKSDYFSLKKAKEFESFLLNNDLAKYNKGPEGLYEFAKSLPNCFEIENEIYYVNPKKFDDDFKQIVRDYLNNLEYSINYKKLYYDELHCFRNYVNKPEEFYCALKYFFTEEYEDKLKFEDNIINVLNSDINLFIINELEATQPIKQREFIRLIKKKTLFGEKFLRENVYLLLKKYVKENNTLEIHTSNLSPDEIEFIHNIFIKGFLTIKKTKQLLENFNSENMQNIDSIIALQELGYKKSGSIIIHEKFCDQDAAFTNWLLNEEFSIPVKKLKEYFDDDYISNPKNKLFKDLYLLELEPSIYMNVIRMFSREDLLKFRDLLVDSLNDDEIIKVSDFIQDKRYEAVLSEFSDFKTEINNSINLNNLLITSEKIYNHSANKNIIRKNKAITNSSILEFEILKQGPVNAILLQEDIFQRYKVNIPITKSTIKDLGFIYNEYTKMIYVNI